MYFDDVADALSVEDTAAWAGSFSHLWRRNTSRSFCVQSDNYYTLAAQGKGCWQSSHQLLASRWSFRSHIPSCCSPTVLCQKEPFWLSYVYIFFFLNLRAWLSCAFVVRVPCSNGSCLGPKNQIAEELFPSVCNLCSCGIATCLCHWLSGKCVWVESGVKLLQI